MVTKVTLVTYTLGEGFVQGYLFSKVEFLVERSIFGVKQLIVTKVSMVTYILG